MFLKLTSSLLTFSPAILVVPERHDGASTAAQLSSAITLTFRVLAKDLTVRGVADLLQNGVYPWIRSAIVLSAAMSPISRSSFLESVCESNPQVIQTVVSVVSAAAALRAGCFWKLPCY